MKSTSPSQSGRLFPASSQCLQQNASAEVTIPANLKLGTQKSSKKERNLKKSTVNKTPKADWETVVMPAKPTKRAKGSVREGEAGKKAKATQQEPCGKFVSEKSQATRTSKNLTEKCTHQGYFVDVVEMHSPRILC